MSNTDDADETDDWQYAITPASEQTQREFTRREMKMQATNDEVYAGPRAREMVEFARTAPEQPRWIGETERDQQDVSLPYDLLFRHVFVGGLTGMGKSTLLKNITQQHIYADKGVCFIDPKGDDILDILMSVPKDRWDDVVFIAPGDDAFRKQVGFNLLETHTDPGDPGFDAEVESIVNDLKALLAGEEYWGPRMDSIASNMLRGMIRHEFEFTLADMFGALLDEDSRAEYANLIQASDEDLAFIQDYTEKIAQLDDTDLDAIRRRLKDWVEEPTMRQIVAQRDTEISIPEAVENEKIILVKNDLPEEPKQAVSTAILRQIWTAVNSRPSERESLLQDIAAVDDGGTGEFDESAVDTAIEEHQHEGNDVGGDYSPFFLVIDEAHDVLADGSKIEKMLAKARSKRLGMTIASQQLRQLDQEARDAILGNCNSLIAYDPGHPQEARVLSRRFGEKDEQDLLETDQFHGWMRTAVEAGKRSKPFLAEAFPPYPPLHDIKETYKLIVESLDRYGTVPATAEEIQDRMHFSTVGGADEETTHEETITDEQAVQVAKAAYDEALRRENEDGFVPVETSATRNRIGRYLPDVDVSHVSLLWHVIDHVPDDLLTVREFHETSEGAATDREGMYMRCTERGKNRIFETGSASSAGGGKHRTLLKEGYEPLFRAGLVVTLPSQSGDDMPDGVGDLSEAPLLDSNLSEHTPHEIRRFTENFRRQQPLLDRLAVPEGVSPLVMRQTQGPAVTLEAESSTGESKPAQSLFNLAQAYNKGHRCLFLCRDDIAETLWQTLTENGYYSHQWEGDHERCYNGSPLVIDGATMLRPADAAETIWLHDQENDEYVLQDSDGEEHARFGSVAAVFGQSEAYPATTDIVPSDQRDNWVPVYQPFVPAYQFDGQLAGEEMWDIIVVPTDAKQPADLRLYQGPNREQQPLTAVVDADETVASTAAGGEKRGGQADSRQDTESRVEGALDAEQTAQMRETFGDEDESRIEDLIDQARDG